MIFFGLVCPKNNHDKIFDFCKKNHWQTPLQNFDFLDFFKTSLFLTKNHSFLSRILNNNLFWINLPKKYPWENIWLFDKNHRLTPLENFDFKIFWTFAKLHFSGLKSIRILSEIPNNNLFWFNLSKTYPWENIRLFENNQLLANSDFWDLLKLHFSCLKRVLFYPEYKNHGIRKMQIFWTFLKFNFLA